MTWNVNGIRARGKQVEELIQQEAPDVLCLQEIKALPEQILPDTCNLPGYTSYWHGGKGGYSGVSLHVREGLGEVRFEVPAIDMESRLALAIVGPRAGSGETVRVASLYAPNGGKDYPAKIAFYTELIAWLRDAVERGESPILMGDMNIAHTDLDLHPSQRKEGVIGQLPEERVLFSRLLEEGKLVDSGRLIHPTRDRLFTWWPYWKAARARNLGWRIDCALVPEALKERIVGADVNAAFGTSDHAPFWVELRD